jgi:hypothetical protein
MSFLYGLKKLAAADIGLSLRHLDLRWKHETLVRNTVCNDASQICACVIHGDGAALHCVTFCVEFFFPLDTVFNYGCFARCIGCAIHTHQLILHSQFILVYYFEITTLVYFSLFLIHCS